MAHRFAPKRGDRPTSAADPVCSNTTTAKFSFPRSPRSFERRISLYSVAAAATSVGVLALCQPAESSVVIKNVNIPVTGGMTLDLNHDGVPDLTFNTFYTAPYYATASYITVNPAKGGGIVAKSGYASALLRSARVGPSANFGTGSLSTLLMEGRGCDAKSCVLNGKWSGNHPNRFLGVKFLIKGKVHYGWVRVTLNSGADVRMSATITEYGYETIANRAVKAGLASNNIRNREPSETHAGPSLGHLAAGADGLTLWRREEGVAQ